MNRSIVSSWAELTKVSTSSETELHYLLHSGCPATATRPDMLIRAIIIIHGDRRITHTSLATHKAITKLGRALLPHAPYGSVLVASSLGSLKDALRGARFETDNSQYDDNGGVEGGGSDDDGVDGKDVYDCSYI